jgi:hypothetical protein
MSNPASSPFVAAGDLLSALTTGFHATEAAIISSVASFSISELFKLVTEELTQLRDSLHHFVTNLRAGMSWGEAMASMLTEVWNNTKSDLAMLATDFVEAVGKVFQNVGLIPAPAAHA